MNWIWFGLGCLCLIATAWQLTVSNRTWQPNSEGKRGTNRHDKAALCLTVVALAFVILWAFRVGA